MEAKNPSNQDEIDIAKLFQSIGNAFRTAGQSILKGMASLRRLFINHIIYFVLIIVSGLTISVIYSSQLSKRYYASMTINCRYLNMRIVENAVEKLNLLCNEKDRQQLSNVLQVPRSITTSIMSFEAKSFVSEQDRIEVEILKEQLNAVTPEKKDLVNRLVNKIRLGNADAFKISVRVLDPNVIQTLDSAMVGYFQDNEYVKKRIEANKKSLISKRAKLLAESEKLDSLKSILYATFQTMSKQTREGSNNVILSDKHVTDPLNIFKEDISLNDEIRFIDEQLVIQPDFEVVDRLTIIQQPTLSLPVILAASMLASILAGYTLLGLWKFNKYLATIG